MRNSWYIEDFICIVLLFILHYLHSIDLINNYWVEIYEKRDFDKLIFLLIYNVSIYVLVIFLLYFSFITYNGNIIFTPYRSITCYWIILHPRSQNQFYLKDRNPFCNEICCFWGIMYVATRGTYKMMNNDIWKKRVSLLLISLMNELFMNPNYFNEF